MIVALIGGGLLLVILGIASGSGTPDSAPGPTATPTPSIAPTTAPTPPVATPTPAAPIRLERRHFAERVSIGVPARWRAGVSDGAVTVAARNGRSTVQVYFQHGIASDARLTAASRSFLLGRHRGARVSGIGRTKIADRRARRITVSYSGGTESAVVLIAKGYTYLILERLTRPVSAELRRQTDAVLTSFRPT